MPKPLEVKQLLASHKFRVLVSDLRLENLQVTTINPIIGSKWFVITDKPDYASKYSVLPVYSGSMPKIFAEIVPDFIKVFPEEINVIDLGCGSGILGLAFAREKKTRRVFALDVNSRALKITFLNFLLNGVDKKLKLMKKSYFKLPSSLLKKKFDVLLSNPPFNPEIPGIPWAIHSSGGNITGTLHFEKQLAYLNRLVKKTGMAFFYMLSLTHDKNGNNPFLLKVLNRLKKLGTLKHKRVFLVKLQKNCYLLKDYEKELLKLHKGKETLFAVTRLIKNLRKMKFKGFNRYAILVIDSECEGGSKILSAFLNAISSYRNGVRVNASTGFVKKSFGREITLLIPRESIAASARIKNTHHIKEVDITMPLEKETFHALYSIWSYAK